MDPAETRDFVAEAVRLLASELGADHPTVAAGRRVLEALESLPGDAIVVTGEDLATAIHRAFPARRNTASNADLTAATILAALRERRPRGGSRS